MIGVFGEVYLLDWGLAKAFGRNLNSGESPETNPSLRRTSDRSPSISSDETLVYNRGESVDPARDVTVIAQPDATFGATAAFASETKVVPPPSVNSGAGSESKAESKWGMDTSQIEPPVLADGVTNVAGPTGTLVTEIGRASCRERV